MSMLSALLRALRHAYASPSLMLVGLEDNLAHTLPRGGLVTMFYGVLDTVSGRLTYASAGHTPGVVWHAATRRIEWHYGRSVPIGAVRGGALKRMLHDETLDLEPGDLLVHFTDGYSEAMREDGEQFGLARIGAVVERHATSGVRAVIDALDVAIRDWAGTGQPMDDETLLVIGRTASAATTETDTSVSRASRDGGVDPLALLRRATEEGSRLTLGADFEQLVAIRAWLQGCCGPGALEPRSARLLESALYEVCANVVEHGYAQQPGCSFDLWWVPGGERLLAPGHSTAANGVDMHDGYFLVQDRGAPFKPQRSDLLDFTDAGVRRKGRGIGLHMIRKILKTIEYHPGTAEGNLTLLQFDFTLAGNPGGRQ